DALLALTRITTAIGPTTPAGGELCTLLATPGLVRDRLVAVLGASSALGDHLVRHPDDLAALAEPSPSAADAGMVRAERLAAVGAEADGTPVATVTGGAGVDAMRRAYRRRLLMIAAADLVSTEPLSLVPAVGAALA